MSLIKKRLKCDIIRSIQTTSDFTTIPPYYNYIKRPSKKSPDRLIKCFIIQFHIHVTVILAEKMVKMLYPYFMFK
jgi:hypothetical protein